MPHLGFIRRTDESLFEALVGKAHAFRVEAQQMQNGGLQVAHAHAILGDEVPEFIGRPKVESAFDTSAGHPDRETVRVMVAAKELGSVPLFIQRCAAEFAAPDDQRIVEKATLLEILDQCGNRLVDLAALVR